MTLSKQIGLLWTSALVLTLVLSSPVSAQFFNNQAPQLLPEAEAFKVSHSVEPDGLTINWSIADDYYMYRDQFGASVEVDGQSVPLILEFPEQGVVENDPEFGDVEVFFFNTPITARFPTSFTPKADQVYALTLSGQGCNKPVGICYPPMKRLTDDQWSEATLSAQTKPPSQIAANTKQDKKSFWTYVLSAFGAGLLLSFTPCVLPMIPILSGIIAKQENPSRLAAGWLAICYVAGTIVTYLIAGWIAGATGTQLQAYFQNPWVIGFICLLLLMLAASLFGLFKMATPTSLQTKVHHHSNSKSAHGNDLVLSAKSFSLGLISALVVGACVSPVLILALGAAITQGDPVLGAAIMGSMAAGMGVLLVAFGFGAGWLLPKTGSWMVQVQNLFGFMVLGVAIYIAGALTAVPVMLLWALLLLVFGFYVWQISNIDSATQRPGLLASTGKAIGFASILWGCLALLGHATGGREILAPLSELSLGSPPQTKIELPFETTTTLEQTLTILQAAKKAQQPVLIDFYADWCFDCVRMKRSTFKEPEVAAALEGWRLVVIDVTDTSEVSQAVKKHFNVFGPPATLVISKQGQEVSDLRQYGFMNKNEFISLISKVPS